MVTTMIHAIISSSLLFLSSPVFNYDPITNDPVPYFPIYDQQYIPLPPEELSFTEPNFRYYRLTLFNPTPTDYMVWSPMSFWEGAQEMLYPCSYTCNGTIVMPSVRNWELFKKDQDAPLARCCIYQTPCNSTSTAETWYPSILSYFERQEGYLNNFEVIESGELNSNTQLGRFSPGKWFFAKMNMGDTLQYHLGYVIVQDGFLYEIYFVADPADFATFRMNFERIAESFTLPQWGVNMPKMQIVLH
jgi:hypothetical protein